MKLLLSILLCVVFFSSCSWLSSKDKKEAIASVGDEYLYLEDIEPIVVNLPKEDSATKVNSYIDSWVKEQLLLQKAMENLTEQQVNFDKQLKNYKNSLLIYTFENELIKQKLDTLVTDRELRSYYTSNLSNFKLTEEVLQVKFVKFINSAPKQDSVNYWLFNDENEEAEQKLTEYCTQFASNCHLDTSIWVSFTKIKEIVQLPADKNLYLSNGKNEFSDSLQTSLLLVYQKKEEGETAPFSFVKSQLKSILLNKRKIQLIAKVKDEIFEDATLNEEYEIYE